MRIVWLIVLGLVYGQGQRRWSIGPQVGLNLPAYRSSEKVQKAAALPGFTGGVAFRYPIKPRWALVSGLTFSQRNSTYLVQESYPADTTVGSFRDEYTVYVTNDGRLELAHIELPMLIEYDFKRVEQMRAYMLMGMHVGYLLLYKNYGTTQVALEGLDFLPLFGFSPQTRVVVAQGPIDRGRVSFRRGDVGLWIGGGNAYAMGRGMMTFEVRAFTGLTNIFARPPGTRFYNGSVLFLTGYLF